MVKSTFLLGAEAKGIREESDYGDYVSFSIEEAKDQFANAKAFIDEMDRALSEPSESEASRSAPQDRRR